MIDPSLEVAASIITRLKAHASVTAIVSARIYDAIPANADKPYVNVAQPQVIPNKFAGDCEAGAEVNVTVHGWSIGPESVAIKQLGAAIVLALDDHELALANNHRTVLCELEQVTYLDDPDGIVKHVAASFRVLTEPT